MPSARSVVRLALAACLSSALLLVALPSASIARPPSDSFERLVDVGGHRLYVRCEGRGGPTVILEAPLGGTSATWSLVQPEVARFTTVCSYDRANLGRSHPAPKPRTAQDAVDDLRALLINAGIRGPYVLVGHSYGGWIVHLLARQDGGRRVTGAVLVDATPPDWGDVLDRFGIPLPAPNQTPEGVDLRASARELQAAPAFPNFPLSVLVRTTWPPGVPEELKQAWHERQVAQSRLSCRGELVEAAGAGHFIQRDRPDLVIASIARVVEEAHETNARKLHPNGHPLPASYFRTGGSGRWDHCPHD